MARFSIICMLLIFAAWPGAVSAQSIDMLWNEVQAPPAPALEQAAPDPATTALLVLDIEQLTCNPERRPRCLETVPRIASLIDKARAVKMPVIYSLTPRGALETILDPVKPQAGEHIVSSSVDKFWNTDLEKILKAKGVTTVIITGTAAHGAVLRTATAAEFRKLKVILPVDCLSAADLYTEQATVQLLLTGPGTRNAIILTRSDMLVFASK
ncbi:MAG: isochorismatase family protein [Desulfatibacillum sp.]|nr:isochorismatase family protein [Desulfatibacillum sp.]